MLRKNNRGITLIALVVTIIVILILAGISISMLTGQNGILNRAANAKEKTEIASIDEQRKLAQAEALMNTEKTTYKGLTLPEGFAPTKIEGEDSIDEGLVITDGYGNEYVWVEVPKTVEVYPTAGLGITNFTNDEYKKIEDGEIDIVVGTHALIQEKVSFKDLALVVTDEQHRFGVRQREALSSKGREPHMLVMSATPIPRTLAIILYGDLDVSVINVMPKGRLPIKNCVVGTNYRPQAYRFMEKEIAAGHQVYIICPMVEESENMEAENVTDYTNMLETTLAPSIRIKALHGKMKASLKNEIMEQFAAHEIDILVSPTVIEVGINVPTATGMMIENAERFGLAQLHQLRGRVGRGDSQSYCIFMAGNPSKETMKRLRVLEDSNDGFFVAKQDLKLRGPGDFFGIRQSGELDFALADIYQDADIMKMANEAAKECEISLKDCNYGKKIVI